MLREIFLGRRPSSFSINPVVKAFILSEVFLWSSWNAIIPIFAIFVVNKIPGGSTEIAAASFSTYLISRVIFELISGKYLLESSDIKKFATVIIGIIFISVGYVGFAMIKNISSIFIFYSIIGLGLGIATPAKNSLFSTHLDKNKEIAEWSLYDGFIFTGMAMAATIGGLIAGKYGFTFLFYLVAATNLLSIIPYFLYAKKQTVVEKVLS